MSTPEDEEPLRPLCPRCGQDLDIVNDPICMACHIKACNEWIERNEKNLRGNSV
jgi:hypothetical protein